MKNNKGQALVEFIAILPVMILVIMAMVDFGNIITKKYALENDLDVVVDMYKENKLEDINNYVKKNNEVINYNNDNNYKVISLSKKITINTPLLNNVMGKNYKINVSRTIMGDKHE